MRLRHILVTADRQKAIHYALQKGWKPNEWIFADTVEKIMGITDATVYLFKEPWDFSLSEITMRLIHTSRVDRLAVVEVSHDYD